MKLLTAAMVATAEQMHEITDERLDSLAAEASGRACRIAKRHVVGRPRRIQFDPTGPLQPQGDQVGLQWEFDTEPDE